MSDSDDTDIVNCEELAAASADMDREKSPVPLTPNPRQALDWCVFVCVGIG